MGCACESRMYREWGATSPCSCCRQTPRNRQPQSRAFLSTPPAHGTGAITMTLSPHIIHILVPKHWTNSNASKSLREIILPKTKGVKSTRGFQMNPRFQGSVQAKNALGITRLPRQSPPFTAGETKNNENPSRANQQMQKRHLPVVAAQRAVGTLRQPLPPGLIPMATPRLCTRDNALSLELPAYLRPALHVPWSASLRGGTPMGFLGSTVGSLPQLPAGPAAS